MFNLHISNVAIVAVRRLLLQYGTDLEMSQAKADDNKCIPRINEQAFRFINYSQ